MRQFTLLVCSLFFLTTASAQSSFQFSTPLDTVHETDGTILAGYLKASAASTQAHDFELSIKSGSGNSSDINNFTTTTISIPANTDSVPIYFAISNDSIVENIEDIQFVLSPLTTNDTLGADSTFSLFIVDDELPATFKFIITNDTIIENQPVYVVKVVCNNPNPTGVRCYIRADDASSTLIGGIEFGFTWGYLNFKPGQDTAVSPAYILDDFVSESLETLVLKLSNFDANNCSDSIFTLYVRDDESPLPIAISFSPVTSITVLEDTSPDIMLQIKVVNPWTKTYFFRVGTNYEGTAKSSDYYIHYNHDPLFAAPPGVSYDTIYVFVKNDPFVEDTEQAYIRFRYESTNTSPDSVYTVNIVDRDTVQIGFLGAAFSFLENQGRCTIKLTTSSPMKTAFSVPVSYYNGNATPNLDFIFTDTIVTFPAFSMDTQEVYVTLLDDQLDELNEQINLRIGDLTPANIGKEGTRQFSLFIIDNDSTVLAINETNADITTSVYPNPLSTWLRISASVAIEQLQIVGIDGTIVFAAELNKEENITLNTVDWSSGIYIVHITTQEGVKSIRIAKN